MAVKRGARALSDEDLTYNPRSSQKRKRLNDSDEELSRKPKSANLTFAERFLIACLSLIWLNKDERDFDAHGRVIPSPDDRRSVKAYAPKSDLTQSTVMDLYFTGLDRTVMSQSKGESHAFAIPDWSLMESYLFPWLSFNRRQQPYPTRTQTQHLAFRILECLTQGDRVVMYHEPHTGRTNDHFQDVRGWWPYTVENAPPERYEEWHEHWAGDLPVDYRKVMLECWAKPWCNEIKPVEGQKFVIDLDTEAPPIKICTIEEKRQIARMNTAVVTSPSSSGLSPRSAGRVRSDLGTSRPSMGFGQGRERPFKRARTVAGARLAGKRPPTTRQPKKVTSSRSDALYTHNATIPSPKFQPLGNEFNDPLFDDITLPPLRYQTSNVQSQYTDQYLGTISLSDMYGVPSGYATHSSLQYPTPGSSSTTESSPVQIPEQHRVGSNYDPNIHANQYWLLDAPFHRQPMSLASSIQAAPTPRNSINFDQYNQAFGVSANLAGLFFGDMSNPATPAAYGSGFQTFATSSPSDGTISPVDLQLGQQGQLHHTSYDDALLSLPASSHLATYPYQKQEDQHLFDQYLVHNPEVDGFQLLRGQIGIDTVEAEIQSDTFPNEQARNSTYFYSI